MLSNGYPSRKTSTAWYVTPSNPSSAPIKEGVGTIWTDSTDGSLHYTDTLGNDIKLGEGGGGTDPGPNHPHQDVTTTASPTFVDVDATTKFRSTQLWLFASTPPDPGTAGGYGVMYQDNGDLWWQSPGGTQHQITPLPITDGDLYNIQVTYGGIVPSNVIMERPSSTGFDNAMGIAIPSVGVTELVSLSVNLGSSSSAAITDLQVNLDEFDGNSGVAYTYGAGTLKYSANFNSGGALSSLFYRSFAEPSLNLTLTPGKFVFVYCALNFWSITDLQITLGFRYTPPP